VFSLHNPAIANALTTSAGGTLPVNLWHRSSYCPQHTMTASNEACKDNLLLLCGRYQSSAQAYS